MGPSWGMVGQQTALEGHPSPKLFRSLPTCKPFWRNGQAFGFYCFKDNPAWSCRLAQGTGPVFNPFPPLRTEDGGNRTTSNSPSRLRIPCLGKMVEI